MAWHMSMWKHSWELQLYRCARTRVCHILLWDLLENLFSILWLWTRKYKLSAAQVIHDQLVACSFHNLMIRIEFVSRWSQVLLVCFSYLFSWPWKTCTESTWNDFPSQRALLRSDSNILRLRSCIGVVIGPSSSHRHHVAYFFFFDFFASKHNFSTFFVSGGLAVWYELSNLNFVHVGFVDCPLYIITGQFQMLVVVRATNHQIATLLYLRIQRSHVSMDTLLFLLLIDVHSIKYCNSH